MTDIFHEHRRRNETTRDRWQEMAPHRARVMQLLAEARAAAGPSLCILGAGNANDVELSALAGVFERIALVDLDEQALARAVERLTEDQRRRVELHAPIDLTGVLPILEAWKANPAQDFPNYAAGTWGPDSANQLIQGCQSGWRKP